MHRWLVIVLTAVLYVVGAKALLIAVFLAVPPLMAWVQEAGAFGLWYAHAAAFALVVLGHHAVRARRGALVGAAIAATVVTGLAAIVGHWNAATRAIEVTSLASGDVAAVETLRQSHAVQGATGLAVVLGVGAALFAVGRRRAGS